MLFKEIHPVTFSYGLLIVLICLTVWVSPRSFPQCSPGMSQSSGIFSHSFPFSPTVVKWTSYYYLLIREYHDKNDQTFVEPLKQYTKIFMPKVWNWFQKPKFYSFLEFSSVNNLHALFYSFLLFCFCTLSLQVQYGKPAKKISLFINF